LKSFSQELQFELEAQLQSIRLESEDPIKTAELSIKILLTAIGKLKKFAVRYSFKDEAEEIEFFKYVKPQFVSKLIFHNRVFNIETKKPHGGEKVVKKYLNNELDKLRRYFDDNLEFYKYFRTNSNYLDHKYFVRNKYDIKLGLDTFHFEVDHHFATSHDFKVAKVIANDLIQVYLEDELTKLSLMETRQRYQSSQTKLNWTATKTSLIELIYALHAQGVFDNGKAEIKDIATYLGYSFDIDLGDYYRTYLELRMRKTGRTKFIDTLKEALSKRMDDLEEK
jgi:hypothetical protein